MKRLVRPNGTLQHSLFSEKLLQKTNQLHAAAKAAAETGCSKIESGHILLALLQIPNGFTQSFFAGEGCSISDFDAGVRACLQRSATVNELFPVEFIVDNFDASTEDVLEDLEKYLQRASAAEISERILLWATLKNLTKTVKDNFLDYPLSEWIEKLFIEVPLLDPFKLENYSSSGSKVISLMLTEAEALGSREVDPRHLLIGFLEFEGGIGQLILYQQNISPKKIQELLMINLRSRARQRSRLIFNPNSFAAPLAAILQNAAREAHDRGYSQIHDVHLLMGFLQKETFARSFLTENGLDLSKSIETCNQFQLDGQAESTTESERKSWKKIQEELENALIGQSDIVDMCLPYIRRTLFGFKRAGKPASVFLFCGPSGVGKTEMAKAIARSVYGGEENLIMLEMGQFQTRESMNIFVGAPPGYIGYGEGKLTNGLRDKPLSVVLFDEVEKAYSQVFDALLRFIDEGRIDDPAGPIRDGSDCIIVMTSNVSTEGLEKLIQNENYRKNKWEVRRRLKEALLNIQVERGPDSENREPFRFRNEFLNRIDEILLFRALDQNDLSKIAQRYMIQYQQRLADEKQIHIRYSPDNETVAHLIGQFCFNLSQGGSAESGSRSRNTLSEGARAVLRITQSKVLDPVIDFVNENGYTPPLTLTVHLKPADHPGDEPVTHVDFQ
jgi:ATP-dependent Clp protease ATP-binding subunit ClpA